MMKLLELIPVRVATRKIILPGPVEIAEQIKKAIEYKNTANIIAYGDPDSIINIYISIFEESGYTRIREAFNTIKSMGIADVTEVEFWKACIDMARDGFSTNVEIAELTDFTE